MIREKDILILHKLLIDQFGGSYGVRDENALHSATRRPFATFEKLELYPDPIEKAAAILESFITDHPFIDGNKRTGYVLARLLLLKYGLEIKATQQEKYEMVMKVSKGEWNYEKIKNWLVNKCR